MKVTEKVGTIREALLRNCWLRLKFRRAFNHTRRTSAPIKTYRVLAIDGETFKGILRERPEASFAVLRSVSRRLREMTG